MEIKNKVEEKLLSEDEKKNNWPADLYLEGGDQFRG